MKKEIVMDLRPFLCGVLFGIYPILANRSKLTSGATFFTLTVVSLLLGLFPFMSNGVASMKSANVSQIGFAVGSALASSIGVLVMFRYLAVTPTERAGGLVIIMVVTQVVATWVFASLFARTMPSAQQLLGVVLAGAAIFLLQR